jgi:hypothetical protein
VSARYTLFKPVFGISDYDQQVTRIPAGALIELPVRPIRIGVVRVAWNGHSITVLFQDLESNGTRIAPVGQNGRIDAPAAPELVN